MLLTITRVIDLLGLFIGGLGMVYILLLSLSMSIRGRMRDLGVRGLVG